MFETKLFGRKIQLPDDGDVPVVSADDWDATEKSQGRHEVGESDQKDAAERKATEIILDDDDDDIADDSRNLDTAQEVSVNPTTPHMDEETPNPINGKPGNDENEATNSEKTLKKPDKLLPCPRCKSMETKFCYYNNYNVNQPRHFCKTCQRYWTAGGTMRNVPVGAGRRKSKNSASYYRHISISEALEAARMEVPNGTHHPKFISNGRVLSFNLDAPNSDPVASVIKKSEEKGSLANCKGGETCKNGSSSVPSVEVETSTDLDLESHTQKINGFPSHIPCLPGVPWPYVWNSSISPPNFFPPGFPLTFYPAAGWNCGVPGPWTTPWFSPQVSSPNESLCSDSKPSSLGKHLRGDELIKEDNISSKDEPFKHRSNGSVLVPKTLRIDDPSEAAKSSIWATLGIKNESVSGGSMFKPFQPKSHEKIHVAKTSPVLQANPAALSRSLVFHESS